MKADIISTEAGHVVHRADRKRGFQICANGRMRSFSTLEAAVAAAKANMKDRVEMNAIIEASRIV